MRLLEHCKSHTRLLLHNPWTALPQRLPLTSSRCGPAGVHVGGTSTSDISTQDRDQGSYGNSSDLKMLAITSNLVQPPWEPHKPICRPFLAQGPPGDNLRQASLSGLSPGPDFLPSSLLSRPTRPARWKPSLLTLAPSWSRYSSLTLAELSFPPPAVWP